MQSLFDAIREACPRGLWAQGVKLARSGSVFLEMESATELELRVRAPGLPVAPTVVLYPEDDEWECDCGSRIDACAHVAAAVIALQSAHQRGESLPSLRRSGRQLLYRFRRSGADLELERAVGDTVISGTVQMIADLEPSRVDLEVDELVYADRRRRPRRQLFADILSALEGLRTVSFEGRSVYTTGDVVLPLGIVSDQGHGVVLEVVPSPSITEVVGSGVALCGDTLQPLGHPEITGDRLEKLPFVKTYAKSEFATLVTEVLPALENDIPVEIRTTRLPEATTSALPRIHLDVQHEERLSVLPTLVYGTPPIARIDGDRLVHLRGPAPIRDRAREKELLAELRDELNLAPGRRVEYAGADAMRFAGKLRAWRGEGIVGGGHDVVLPNALLPRLDLSAGFELEFESQPDEESPEAPVRRASASAVIGAWQSGLELVPLIGGGWAPLPLDWLAEHGERVVDLLAAREANGTVPGYALPDLAALSDELGEPRPRITEAVSELIAGFDGIPAVDPPDDFRGVLRSYQKSGVSWLCCLRDAGLGAVLADDMGLGKTVQTLCAVQGRTLVVCPTSVLPTWEAESRRFRPALGVCTYHGPKRELDERADLTLTTYALLRIDSKQLREVEWDTVVLDEAQAIKNPQSQVARAAHKLRARFRLTLSGTPVENRLEELWSQMHFANPGLLGERTYFQKRYARPIARQEPGAARRLRDRIRPFLLRRLKQEVEPELPPRTDLVLYCELDENERAVYDAIRVATREEVVSKLRSGGNVLAALEALLRLRQASCHSALVPGQEAASSTKIIELMGALESVIASGHKALVFSQWTSLLDLVEPHLRQAALEFVRLDGSTRNRGAVVDEFQSKAGPPVMLVSLKAGGTGLTLTAADHVYLLDPWWNPAVEDQAADRTHRIGQTRPVMVHRLVAADTVESRILALQERKRALADAALGDAAGAAELTREDLIGLLE